jgi:hypothetical protein
VFELHVVCGYVETFVGVRWHLCINDILPKNQYEIISMFLCFVQVNISARTEIQFLNIYLSNCIFEFGTLYLDDLELYAKACVFVCIISQYLGK